MITAYLSLPLSLPGVPGESYSEKAPDKEVILKVIPGQIVCYHEGFFPGCTFIYLANGQPFAILLSVAEYEAQITGYWEAVLKEQTKKTNGSEIKRKLGIIN